MDIFEQLAAPFPADKVSWRVAMALAYIDARDVMERLDKVVGPSRWQARYSHADKKTICELSIFCQYEGTLGGEWVAKANGAGDSDIEAEKGAISDAFKRAAVMWGIGRYLYDVSSPWVQINEFKQIEDGEYAKLATCLPKPIAQRKELSPEEKAAAALAHANIHAEASKGHDKVEYANANRGVMEACSKYPEALKVLQDAGLVAA